MKYIDAEKLIAEIRKLCSESCISESDDYYEYAKSEIIDIITSLQQEQPEVHLEKEIKNYLATKCAGDDEPSVSEIARHFAEWGAIHLNARKEENI